VGKLKIDKLVLALVEYGTIEKAAAALGISSVTAWRLMKKSAFQEAFRKARRDHFSCSMARVQYATSAAVAVLYQIAMDKDAPPASRVRAAATILTTAATAFEHEDLEVRVEQLEQRANEKTRKETDAPPTNQDTNNENDT
jgi:hypothetical protein